MPWEPEYLVKKHTVHSVYDITRLLILPIRRTPLESQSIFLER